MIAPITTFVCRWRYSGDRRALFLSFAHVQERDAHAMCPAWRWGNQIVHAVAFWSLIWQDISGKGVELWPSPIGIAKMASRSAVSADFAALTGYQENGNGSSVWVQCR